MTWTVNDPLIESPEILEKEFHDIRSAGFRGVAVWIRCSRYSWDDALARKALRRIGELCDEHSMPYWIGPDPRFVSHELTRPGRGLEVVAFGDRTRADVFPNFAPVEAGAFSLRCETPARHVHMLRDVAIEYYPVGIVRAYAVPASKGVFDDDDVIDITDDTHFFHNARDQYVEAFGKFDPPDSDAWKVIAFFRFRTNHVDFSDSRQMRAYAGMLDRLREEGVTADGMIWDEPGFTCTYGTVPYTKAMRRTFKRRTGHPLKASLWKLALDSADGSHVAVRNRYYRIIQETVNDAQRKANKQARHLWGKDTVAGIHDTWHFESGDMCDMNHGSLDLWEALRTKSGGFVDLGGVNDLKDPDSPYYANLAAMGVMGASLGRWSKRRFAMNNLWTIGDDEGEGWQRSVMDHCVNTMAVFGTRWLAHAYGPVGTIGEERSFLGSPPLPGYPDHSTWSSYPEWNRRLEEHFRFVEDSLPVANVLVVYPVETLYALADSRADDAAHDVFNLILDLVDAHYHVEVLSSALFSTMGFGDSHRGLDPDSHPGLDPGSSRREGRLHKDTHSYDAVIYPHPQIVSRKLLPLLHGNTEREGHRGQRHRGQRHRGQRHRGQRHRGQRHSRESGNPDNNQDSSAVWIPGQARDDCAFPTERNLLYVFGSPERTDRNEPVLQPTTGAATGSADVIQWLESLNLPDKVDAPASAWVSLTRVRPGAVVTLAPARHGYSYEGTVTYAGMSLELDKQTGLTRILFPERGDPEPTPVSTP